jgi:hypothetical protein
MPDNDEVSGGPEGLDPGPEQTRPVLPPDPAAEPVAAGVSAPVMKARWRDRAWSFRAMLAVALATLLLGGIAGGTIVAVADDDHDQRHAWMGPGGPGKRMPPDWRGPRHFQDGGPGWRWNDGPQPPDGDVTPYGQPSPPTPTPSQ